jgi:hypothetical protein
VILSANQFGATQIPCFADDKGNHKIMKFNVVLRALFALAFMEWILRINSTSPTCGFWRFFHLLHCGHFPKKSEMVKSSIGKLLVAIQRVTNLGRFPITFLLPLLFPQF